MAMIRSILQACIILAAGASTLPCGGRFKECEYTVQRERHVESGNATFEFKTHNETEPEPTPTVSSIYEHQPDERNFLVNALFNSKQPVVEYVTNPYPAKMRFNPSSPATDATVMFQPRDPPGIPPSKQPCDLTRKMPCDSCEEIVKRVTHFCSRESENMDELGRFCDANYNIDQNEVKNPDCHYIIKRLPEMFCPNPCKLMRAKGFWETPKYVCRHSLIQCEESVSGVPPTPPPVATLTKPVDPLRPSRYEPDKECGQCKKTAMDMVEWCQKSENIDDLDRFCDQYYPVNPNDNTPWPIPNEECRSIMEAAKAKYAPHHPCANMKCPADTPATEICEYMTCSKRQ